MVVFQVFWLQYSFHKHTLPHFQQSMLPRSQTCPYVFQHYWLLYTRKMLPLLHTLQKPRQKVGSSHLPSLTNVDPLQRLYQYGFILSYGAAIPQGLPVLILPPCKLVKHYFHVLKGKWEEFIPVKQLAMVMNATKKNRQKCLEVYKSKYLPAHRIKKGVPIGDFSMHSSSVLVDHLNLDCKVRFCFLLLIS